MTLDVRKMDVKEMKLFHIRNRKGNRKPDTETDEE